MVTPHDARGLGQGIGQVNMASTSEESFAFIGGAFISLVPFVGTGYVMWAAYKWQADKPIGSRIGAMLITGCLHFFLVSLTIFHILAET